MKLPSSPNLIKIGATYMITINIETSDAMTNGARGTLEKMVMVKMSDGTLAPLRIYIKFEDKSIGLQTREKFKAQLIKDSAHIQTTPIERKSIKMPESYGYSINGTRNQFPLVPAHAITKAKCQSSIYQKSLVNMVKT